MLLFGGVEILGKDALAGFKPFDVFYLREVEQHPAADDALTGDIDRAFAGAEESHLAPAEAVVHPAVPEDVAERVQVGGRETVMGDREVVRGAAHAMFGRV